MAVFTKVEGRGKPMKGVSLKKLFRDLDSKGTYSQIFFHYHEVEVGIFEIRIMFDIFGQCALPLLSQLDKDLRAHFDALDLRVTDMLLSYKGEGLYLP